MIGVIQERAQTESGSKYVTIDSKRYYFGRDINSFPEVGQKIDFEYNEFGEARGKFGKPRSISSWKPVLNGAGKPETGSTVAEVDVLRSVSNIVGSACAAGTVKSPEELEKWIVAAHAGLTRRARAATGVDPELNDDLPDQFYQSENPEPAPRQQNGSAGRNW